MTFDPETAPGPGRGRLGLEVGIDRVSRRYGSIVAVEDVSLTIASGEFVSLLGPSGSGKTTLLMMLAGFEDPDSGTITIGNRDVTRVAPNKRDIAMVFQRYALFPHMSVAENIAFPLVTRKVARAERESRVTRALEMVQLSGYGDRKPSALSGGQQQRVALARAIVFEPPVILMDEPLGALDKKLRQHMQIELKQLQRRLGATVIYVTHDQEEALTMSDRVAVMSQGKLRQLGAPRTLYDDPADPFVADFLGEMNFLPGVVDSIAEGVCGVALAGGRSTARAAAGAPLPPLGRRIRVAVRPEAVTIAPDEAAPEDGGCGVTATVTEIVFNGATIVLLLQTADGGRLTAALNPALYDTQIEPGRLVRARWSPRAAIAFEDGA